MDRGEQTLGPGSELGETTSSAQIGSPPEKLDKTQETLKKWNAECRLHAEGEQFVMVEHLGVITMVNAKMARELKEALDSGKPIPPYLAFLLNEAVEYGGGTEYAPTLNALSKLRPDWKEGDPIYLLLGFYLFLVIEAAMRGTKPFDQACADNSFGFDVYQKLPTNSKELLVKSLKDAGIYTPSMEQTISDWCSKGIFVFDLGFVKERQTQNLKGKETIRGTFAKIEEIICKLGDSTFARINSAIAFAQGMAEEVQNFATGSNPEKAAYIYFAKLIKGYPDNQKQIEDIIAKGKKTQLDGLCKKIVSVFEDQIANPNTSQVNNLSLLREAFVGLPTDVTDILDAEMIQFTYSDDKDVAKNYPATNVPPSTIVHCDKSRKSGALRVPQFRTIFLSNGCPAKFVYRPTEPTNAAEGIEPELFKILKVRSEIAHEFIHVLFGSAKVRANSQLSAEIVEMKIRAMEIAKKLHQMPSADFRKYLNRLTIVDNDLTIDKVINTEAPDNIIYFKNEWAEEAIGNIYGMMCGEEQVRGADSLLFSSGNDYEVPEAVRELRAFCRDLQRLVSKGRNFICEPEVGRNMVDMVQQRTNKETTIAA